MLTGHILSGSRSLWLLVVMSLAVIGFTEGCGDSESENVGTRADVLQSEYLLGFETSPAGLNVTIDDVDYTTPVEFLWQENDIHLIGVPPLQYLTNESRYAWFSWSDGGIQTHPIVVTDDQTYVAHFGLQFLVTFTSDPPGIIPQSVDGVPHEGPYSFWCDAGTTIYLPPIDDIDTGNGTRYVFRFWGTDPGTPLPMVIGGDRLTRVTIVRPITVIAVFDVQYYLIVEVPWPDVNTTGEGWYDDGTIAYAGLESRYHYESHDTRWVFDHWSGAATGSNYSKSDPILMTGPRTATSVWKKQYRLSFGGWGPSPGFVIIVDGIEYAMPVTFWWDDGSEHEVGVPLIHQPEPDTRFVFLQWIDDMGQECNWPFFGGVVRGPSACTPVYHTEFLLTVETVPSGLTFTLDHVEYTAPESFWFQVGEVHRLGTASVQEAGGASYVWRSWSNGGPIAQDFTVVAPFTYVALFETQYQIVFMSPDGAVVEIDNVSHTMPFTFWCDEGTTHTARFPSPQLITPNTRYVFQSWTHPDFLGNPATFVCDSDKSTSVIVAIQHYVTVETLPDPNLEIRVDSIPYAAPMSFWWDQGAVHDLDVISPQVVDPTTAYFWKNWSDGGDQCHTITVDGPATYAATFVIKHMVNITTSPMGLQIEVNGINYITPHSFWSEEGSEHEVCAPNPPMGIVFSHWSDGGDQCHTVKVTGPMTLVAYYILGYEVTVDTSPWVPIVEVDGVVHEPPATFGWELDSIHMICAPSPQVTLNGTLFFSHWSDGGARCHTITANQSATYTAYYTGTVQVTIDTLPTFQEIIVDGTPYITPKLFYWDLGSVHTVEAHELIAVGQNASLRFSHWSDGGNRSHTVVVEDSGAFVAYYDTHYRIVVDTVPRGLNISVDGQNVTSLAVFWWKEGSMHSLVPLSPQELNRTRYMFIMWGDGNYPPKRVLLVREPWTCVAIYKPIRGISVVILPELIGGGYSGMRQDWPSEPGPCGDNRMARWERERTLPGP